MYEIKTRIRYSETDSEEVLTPIGIIDYFQDVATFHSEDIGQGGKLMLEKGYAWVLCSWQVDIRRYPVFGEELIVGTIPYEFKGCTGMRNCYMKDERGEVIVRANSIWAFMDMNAQKPIKVPEFVSSAYGYGEKLDMEYLPRRIDIPNEGGEVLDAVEVGNERLDILGHVNNGQFVRVALSCSRKEDRPKRIRVEYKTQAHAGDVFVPVRFENEDTEIITLKSPEGGIYATLELN